MASGAGMSWQYYTTNSRHGNVPTAQNGQIGGDIPPELHLKMSKKIAQLTKVIYALNTKNDEHELEVSRIKEAHKDELQQLMAEMQGKIELYRSKIGSELDMRRQIESLESTISEHERIKRQAITEFEIFKQNSEEKERHIRSEHSQQLANLARQLETAQKEFQAQLKSFQQQQQAAIADKETSLQELRSVYQRQVDEILNKQRSQTSELAGEKEKVQQEMEQQILKLRQDCDNLEAQNRQVAHEYEDKISKQKALFEKELLVLQGQLNEAQNSQLSSQENEGKLKSQMSKHVAELTNKVSQLTQEIAIRDEDIRKHANDLWQTKTQLTGKDKHITKLSEELNAARGEAATMLGKVKELEGEVATLAQRCESQGQDMIQKASLLSTLEELRLTNANKIRDLQQELQRTNDRSKWLEEQCNGLKDQTQTTAQKQNSQIASLEKSLESLSLEKQQLGEEHAKEVLRLQKEAEELQNRLLAEHAAKMNELERQHLAAMAAAREHWEREMSSLQRDLQDKMSLEVGKLSQEKSVVESELDQLTSDLSHKLTFSEREADRLRKLVEESQSGLGTATSQINMLRETSAKLQEEVVGARSQLNNAKQTIENLRKDLEMAKNEHQTALSRAHQDHMAQLKSTAAELENSWIGRMQNAQEQLKRQLEQQYTEERKGAVQHVNDIRMQEMEEARKSWQSKLNDLTRQLTEYKTQYEAITAQSAAEKDATKRWAEQEKDRLQKELDSIIEKHQGKISAMEAEHQNMVSELSRQKEEELKALQEKLSASQASALSAEREQHQQALVSVREQAQVSLQTEVSKVKEMLGRDMDNLRMELAHMHAAELEELNRGHRAQLQAARMELERAMQISQRQQQESDMKISELQENLQQKTTNVENLQRQMHGLDSSVSSLRKELDVKGQEILRVRSETNQIMYHRENELRQQHQIDIDNLTAEHLRETQSMLGDFNRAQELLKDKISALQIKLEEAEDRFQRRESRPEDMEMIKNLREALSSRELEMKKLIEEKRYYQLELVNRETNYNKVFSAMGPNVGVMNPLATKRKKTEKTGPTRFESAPNLMALGGPPRLDPLPGSSSPTNDFFHAGGGKVLPVPSPPKQPKKFLQ
ncbi:protein FAM184A-like [Branchiostoma lanceolatum]|uniref:protein FAM184A-like n=1 Tax=Branchiostoma lanceolatum TaxID=7740 RepID=UPI00345124D5